MGFHPLDLIVIVALGLLLFGPRALQSLSHKAGEGVGRAKEMKDKLMSELPMEEISKINKTISSIPTSPAQVAQKLVTSALTPEEKKDASEKSEALSNEAGEAVQEA
jgi:Sec-independent protein translocase protein TatA